MAKKRQDDGSEVETDDNEAPAKAAEAESTKENAMAKPDAAPSVDLVKVRKGDETLEVHPDTLEAHIKAGWTAV